MPMKFTAGSVLLNTHSRAGGDARAKFACSPHGLLGGFYFVPDFVVLGPAWDISPEINALLILVDVVEVQILFLPRTHKPRRLRIGGRIAGHIADFFLGPGLDHVCKEFVSQVFVVASGGD